MAAESTHQVAIPDIPYPDTRDVIKCLPAGRYDRFSVATEGNRRTAFVLAVDVSKLVVGYQDLWRRRIGRLPDPDLVIRAAPREPLAVVTECQGDNGAVTLDRFVAAADGYNAPDLAPRSHPISVDR